MCDKSLRSKNSFIKVIVEEYEFFLATLSRVENYLLSIRKILFLQIEVFHMVKLWFNKNTYTEENIHDVWIKNCFALQVHFLDVIFNAFWRECDMQPFFKRLTIFIIIHYYIFYLVKCVLFILTWYQNVILFCLSDCEVSICFPRLYLRLHSSKTKMKNIPTFRY